MSWNAVSRGPAILAGSSLISLASKILFVDNICFHGPSKYIYQYGCPRSVDGGHDHGYPGAQEYHTAENKRVLRISADTG